MIKKLMETPQLAAVQKQLDAMAPRDRMALSVLTLVIFMLILAFGVMKPAYEFSEGKKADLERNKDLLAFVQSNENVIRAISRQGASDNNAKKLDSQQLVSTVTNRAKRFGLNLKRFEPSGDNKIKVWIEQSSFDKTVRWLTDLRQSLQISVEQISIEKDDESGIVNVRLTLVS